jgi:hypothetical protein
MSYFLNFFIHVTIFYAKYMIAATRKNFSICISFHQPNYK